jgi:dolichyl-phosphate-mannose-protein mannosyltransferase
MSGSFRARRPVSPPLDIPKPVLTTSQRFPHPRGSHLDADERRAVASKGFGPSRTRNYPTGGLHITSGEWKVLVIVVLIAFAVRLFRLSKPNSTV